MLCDSSFCYNDILPAEQTLLLKISFLDSQQHTGAAGGSMDLGDQRHTGIHFARRRIYDKDMLHWPVPFSMDSLRSIDSYYCIFFKAKVQYPAAK